MRCPYCHSEVNEKDVFYLNCGARLKTPNLQERASPPLFCGGNSIAAEAPQIQFEETAREAFIKKVYVHLLFSILLFGIIELMLISSNSANVLAEKMVSGKNWIFVLIAYIGVSSIAMKCAETKNDKLTQYIALLVYIVAEAVIFLPLLLLAETVAYNAIPHAIVLTATLCVGLTICVFVSGKRFDILYKYIIVGGLLSAGLIFSAIIFGFNLGLLFSVCMIFLGSMALLYQTDAIAYEYGEDDYVATSMAIFSSVMLIFWYILRMFIQDDE